jgi:hypothetical protein
VLGLALTMSECGDSGEVGKQNDAESSASSQKRQSATILSAAKANVSQATNAPSPRVKGAAVIVERPKPDHQRALLRKVGAGLLENFDCAVF